MSRIDQWHEQLVRRLGSMGREYVRPFLATKSRTLAKSLTIQRREADRPGAKRVAINTPYYWALYVNDGRQPFTKERLMVFFRNPADDPRLAGGYPVRRSQVKKLSLSADEFRFWQAENALARKLGLPEPMVVTRAIYKPTSPTKFFENDGGMAGFPEVAAVEVRRQFGDLVKSELGEFLDRREDVSIL